MSILYDSCGRIETFYSVLSLGTRETVRKRTSLHVALPFSFLGSHIGSGGFEFTEKSLMRATTPAVARGAATTAAAPSAAAAHRISQWSNLLLRPPASTTTTTTTSPHLSATTVGAALPTIRRLLIHVEDGDGERAASALLSPFPPRRWIASQFTAQQEPGGGRIAPGGRDTTIRGTRSWLLGAARCHAQMPSSSSGEPPSRRAATVPPASSSPIETLQCHEQALRRIVLDGVLPLAVATPPAAATDLQPLPQAETPCANRHKLRAAVKSLLWSLPDGDVHQLAAALTGVRADMLLSSPKVIRQLAKSAPSVHQELVEAIANAASSSQPTSRPPRSGGTEDDADGVDDKVLRAAGAQLLRVHLLSYCGAIVDAACISRLRLYRVPANALFPYDEKALVSVRQLYDEFSSSKAKASPQSTGSTKENDFEEFVPQDTRGLSSHATTAGGNAADINHDGAVDVTSALSDVLAAPLQSSPQLPVSDPRLVLVKFGRFRKEPDVIVAVCICPVLGKPVCILPMPVMPAIVPNSKKHRSGASAGQETTTKASQSIDFFSECRVLIVPRNIFSRSVVMLVAEHKMTPSTSASLHEQTFALLAEQLCEQGRQVGLSLYAHTTMRTALATVSPQDATPSTTTRLGSGETIETTTPQPPTQQSNVHHRPPDLDYEDVVESTEQDEAANARNPSNPAVEASSAASEDDEFSDEAASQVLAAGKSRNVVLACIPFIDEAATDATTASSAAAGQVTDLARRVDESFYKPVITNWQFLAAQTRNRGSGIVALRSNTSHTWTANQIVAELACPTHVVCFLYVTGMTNGVLNASFMPLGNSVVSMTGTKADIVGRLSAVARRRGAIFVIHSRTVLASLKMVTSQLVRSCQRDVILLFPGDVRKDFTQMQYRSGDLLGWQRRLLDVIPGYGLADLEQDIRAAAAKKLQKRLTYQWEKRLLRVGEDEPSTPGNAATVADAASNPISSAQTDTTDREQPSATSPLVAAGAASITTSVVANGATTTSSSGSSSGGPSSTGANQSEQSISQSNNIDVMKNDGGSKNEIILSPVAAQWIQQVYGVKSKTASEKQLVDSQLSKYLIMVAVTTTYASHHRLSNPHSQENHIRFAAFRDYRGRTLMPLQAYNCRSVADWQLSAWRQSAKATVQALRADPAAAPEGATGRPAAPGDGAPAAVFANATASAFGKAVAHLHDATDTKLPRDEAAVAPTTVVVPATVVPPPLFCTRDDLLVDLSSVTAPRCFCFPPLDDYDVLVVAEAKNLLLLAWEDPALVAFIRRGGRIWCPSAAEYFLSTFLIRSPHNSLSVIAERYGLSLTSEVFAGGQFTERQAATERPSLTQESTTTSPVATATGGGSGGDRLALANKLCCAVVPPALLPMSEEEKRAAERYEQEQQSMTPMIRDPLGTSVISPYFQGETDAALRVAEEVFKAQIARALKQAQLTSIVTRQEALVALADIEYRGIFVNVHEAAHQRSSSTSVIKVIDNLLYRHLSDVFPLDMPRDWFSWSNPSHRNLFFLGGPLTSGAKSQVVLPPASPGHAVALVELVYVAGCLSDMRGHPALLEFAKECDLPIPVNAHAVVDVVSDFLDVAYGKKKTTTSSSLTSSAASSSHSQRHAAPRSVKPARSTAATPPKPFKPSNFRLLVYDLETTGLNANDDRIVEICIHEPETGKTFSSLVNPKRRMPENVIAIHGITDAMVQRAPTFDTLIPAIYDYFDMGQTTSKNNSKSGGALANDDDDAEFVINVSGKSGGARRAALAKLKQKRAALQKGRGGGAKTKRVAKDPNQRDFIIMMAHNGGKLDEPVLRAEFSRAGIPFDDSNVLFGDSVPLFRAMRQTTVAGGSGGIAANGGGIATNSLRLATLRMALRVDVDSKAHRAKADTLALWKCLVAGLGMTSQPVHKQVLGVLFAIGRSVTRERHNHALPGRCTITAVTITPRLEGEVVKLFEGQPEVIASYRRRATVDPVMLAELSENGSDAAALLLKRADYVRNQLGVLQPSGSEPMIGDDSSPPPQKLLTDSTATAPPLATPDVDEGAHGASNTTDPEDATALMFVHKFDNCLHQDICITGSTTGRTSSMHPNCQSIPKDDKSGQRRMFCSRFGRDHGFMVEVDFKQLEVAILALLAQDARMLNDLASGVDFHLKRCLALAPTATYDELKAKLAVDDPSTVALRRVAKIMSFQRIYGGGVRLLAKSSGLDVEDIERMIAREESDYPGIVELHKTIRQLCFRAGNPGGLERCIVEMPTGLRVAFPLHDAEHNLPTLKNYPIQAFGAELVQLAVARLFYHHFATKEYYGHRAYIVNFIHDSIWIDAHDDVVEEVIRDTETTFKNLPGLVKETFPHLAPQLANFTMGASTTVGRDLMTMMGGQSFIAACNDVRLTRAQTLPPSQGANKSGGQPITTTIQEEAIILATTNQQIAAAKLRVTSAKPTTTTTGGEAVPSAA